MKKIFFLAIIFCSFTITALGQISTEYLQRGTAKHEKQDYEGAIADYDSAIEADGNNKLAYYNRGVCQLMLKNFDAAMRDFDKTIEFDPEYTRAYYSRASVFISQEEYTDALPDLDKLIELDEAFPNALTLRGQVRAQTGNKRGACEDFTRAKELGDKQAITYLHQFCGNEQLSGESFMLYWPDNENWKVGNRQENEQIMMLELIHANETLENWTEIGTMMSVKGVTGILVADAMDLMFQKTKENAPDAKLTFIEKDETAEHPWIIFIIESPRFKDDEIPESQLWYIVQGKQALYTNFRAVKQAAIPEDLKTKWIQFFKTGKIVYK